MRQRRTLLIRARCKTRWNAAASTGAIVACLAAASLFLQVEQACAGDDVPPPIASDPTQKKALTGLVGEDFHVRETNHFIIVYDTSHEIVRALTGRLEGTYLAVWRFCRGEKLPYKDPAKKLEVVLFNDYSDYARACERIGADPALAAGFFEHGSNRAYFCNVMSRPELKTVVQRLESLAKRLSASSIRTNRRDRNSGERSQLQREKRSIEIQLDRFVDDYNRVIINHEATHHILFNMGVHRLGAQTPGWLTEGMAVQFEVPQRYGKSGLCGLNHHRYGDLREALGVADRDKEVSHQRFAKSVAQGRLLPLRSMIADPRSVGALGPNGAYYYAQAWSFVHFLHHKHREKFQVYVSAVAGRLPGQVFSKSAELRLFESVFGPIDANFEREWLAHALSAAYDRKRAGRSGS